jgi:hypothetical protein
MVANNLGVDTSTVGVDRSAADVAHARATRTAVASSPAASWLMRALSASPRHALPAVER